MNIIWTTKFNPVIIVVAYVAFFVLDSFHLLDPRQKIKAAFLHVRDKALIYTEKYFQGTILTSVSRNIAPFLRVA